MNMNHSPVLRNKRWITTPFEVTRQVILLVIPTRILLTPKQYQTRKVGGESHTRLYDSAPSKIAVSKGKDKIPEADTMKANATNLETEDAIPAANYEPSDSSDDFQLQVN